MKRLTAITVTFAAFATLGAGIAHSAITVVPASDGQDRIVHRGGVIRVGSSVYLLTNSSHAAVGLTRTQLVNGCYLRVYIDNAVGEQVMSVVVEEDETLSRLGIRAGASGGNVYTNIYFYRADGRPVCANNKSLGNANIWVDVQHLAPPTVEVEDLKPAPSATPTLEPQQRSVPSDARAPVIPLPAP
jgi:hypothetical protein